MMQQYRTKYPANWETLSRECKERAGWKCEDCGVAQHSIAISKRGTPYFIYLHAAHIHHDQASPDPELKALCVACHGRHDWQQRQRAARVHLEHIKHLRQLTAIGAIEVQAYT